MSLLIVHSEQACHAEKILPLDVPESRSTSQVWDYRSQSPALQGRFWPPESKIWRAAEAPASDGLPRVSDVTVTKLSSMRKVRGLRSG
jgi:hypothetical protein